MVNTNSRARASYCSMAHAYRQIRAFPLNPAITRLPWSRLLEGPSNPKLSCSSLFQAAVEDSPVAVVAADVEVVEVAAVEFKLPDRTI